MTTVGWREHVGLPDWGIRRVKAKIDTGARTSAIHVGEIEEMPDGRLRFEVVTRTRPRERTVWVEAEPVRTSVVRPSTGRRQERHVVRTTMRLGGRDREIEIGLVCRKHMLCRMLVGRAALEGMYLVDPSRKYVVTERRKPRVQDGEANT